MHTSNLNGEHVTASEVDVSQTLLRACAQDVICPYWGGGGGDQIGEQIRKKNSRKQYSKHNTGSHNAINDDFMVPP